MSRRRRSRKSKRSRKNRRSKKRVSKSRSMFGTLDKLQHGTKKATEMANTALVLANGPGGGQDGSDLKHLKTQVKHAGDFANAIFTALGYAKSLF